MFCSGSTFLLAGSFSIAPRILRLPSGLLCTFLAHSMVFRAWEKRFQMDAQISRSCKLFSFKFIFLMLAYKK